MGLINKIGGALVAAGSPELYAQIKRTALEKIQLEQQMKKEKLEMDYKNWQMSPDNPENKLRAAQAIRAQSPDMLEQARTDYYNAQAKRVGSPQQVFTVDPMSGEIKPSGSVPYGARVVSSPVQIPPSEAGRYTLSNEAIGSIADVKSILFPDGTPKSFKSDIANKAQIARWGALPKDKEGQRVFRKLSTALSGRQLIQTGVAARPEETNLLYKQFYGNMLSDPEALYEGLTQLENFYKGYNKTLTSRGASEVEQPKDEFADMSDDELRKIIAGEK